MQTIWINQSANRLSSWEHGHAKPGLGNLMKLSALYRIPVEKLYPSLARKAPATHRPKKKACIEEASVDESNLEAMNTEQLLDALAEMIVEAYLYQKKKGSPMTDKPR